MKSTLVFLFLLGLMFSCTSRPDRKMSSVGEEDPAHHFYDRSYMR